MININTMMKFGIIVIIKRMFTYCGFIICFSLVHCPWADLGNPSVDLMYNIYKYI